jgi:hypothetical protein
MSKELAVDPVALREEVKTNNRMTPRGSEGEKKARLFDVYGYTFLAGKPG